MNKSLSPVNILVIDDDPVARMLAKRNLEIAGFTGPILTAENGNIGFDILSNTLGKFLIILDYHMPDLDGLGFLRKMEANNVCHPTFMLSSSILETHKSECTNFECVQEYIVKPIEQLKTKKILNFITNDFS